MPDTDGEDAEVSEHGCQYLEAEAISSLAGPLAERRFLGEELGPPLPTSAGTDQAVISGIAHSLYDDRNEARMWLRATLGRAIRVVEDDKRFWLPVTAVAAALLREHTLTSDEVSRLVHESTIRPQR